MSTLHTLPISAIGHAPEGGVRRKPKSIRRECEGERYRFLSIRPIPFEASTDDCRRLRHSLNINFPLSLQAPRRTLNVNSVNDSCYNTCRRIRF